MQKINESEVWSEFSLVISVDPGLKGGLCLFSKDKDPIIYPMPLKTIIKKGKNKGIIDIKTLAEIFRKNVLDAKKTLCILEKQHPRFGEGSVSSFTNGLGYGALNGIVNAFQITNLEITPTEWHKKMEDDYDTKEVIEMKEQLSILRKNKNKKEATKLNGKIKKEAKSRSRDLASKAFPSLSDNFKKVGDDGKAESVLIGIYVISNYGELAKDISKF
jgi:hypothetical protein